MVLWECTGCGTQYAVGLLSCPRCRSFEYLEEGSIVPKTTMGGVSNVHATPGEVGHVPPAEEPVAGVSGAATAPATPQPEPEPEESASPKAADSKATWAAYQVARGLDPAEADGMRKAELMAWEPPAPGNLGAEPATAGTVSKAHAADVAEAQVTRADGSTE